MSSLKLSLQALNSIPSGIVAYRDFHDIDELAMFLPEQLKLTPLGRQPFYCSSMALYFETIQFSFNQVNVRLHAVGEKYPDFLTFTCLLHGQGQPVIAHQLPISEDYLWGFDPNRGANMVFPGGSTHCAVRIRQDVFAACVQAMNRPELNARYFARNCVYLPETLPPLRAYLYQLYVLLRQRSVLLSKPDFQQLILQDFLPLLISALPRQQDHSPVKAFRRSHLVQQANDYMQTHLEQPLTLTDLCQVLGTSSRALCYGFQELFGMSPMAYLKILRLQGVYRVLKATEPGQNTVTEIAAHFGFCHLSYFAQDYKQMFGELPSETLKR